MCNNLKLFDLCSRIIGNVKVRYIDGRWIYEGSGMYASNYLDNANILIIYGHDDYIEIVLKDGE